MYRPGWVIEEYEKFRQAFDKRMNILGYQARF